MTLKKHISGDIHILHKIVTHKIVTGAQKGKNMPIGIAFRTYDAPIGYFPLYGANDFNFSGETSFKEELMARMPINLSAAGSPHSLLLKEAAGDVEFLGSGSEDLTDIQLLVKKDQLKHALACASGVFVDSVMAALGGPAIKSLIKELVKSKIKQFILSKAISSAAKKYLKEQGHFDASRILNNIP